MNTGKSTALAIRREAKSGYDVNSWGRNVLFFIAIHPLLLILPSHTQRQVKKSHKLAHDVVEYRTSHKALEAVYTGGYEESSNSFLQKIFHKLWMSTSNAKGLRNRLQLTQRLIKEHLLELTIQGGVKNLQLLSIASGSARSIVDVLSELDLKGVTCHVTFLDKNPEALEYSKELVEQSSLVDKGHTFSWIEGTANTFLNTNEPDKEYHLIEMVGLMDYFEDEKVRNTMASIKRRLSVGSRLITANIIPNVEQRFMTKVVDWPVIYRKPSKFADLISSSGFSPEKIEVYVEPMNMHVVVSAKK